MTHKSSYFFRSLFSLFGFELCQCTNFKCKQAEACSTGLGCSQKPRHKTSHFPRFRRVFDVSWRNS
jgi:hypothetical protein